MVRSGESEGSSVPADAAAEDDRLQLVFLGTSLTEGLGLDRPSLEGWPARIGELADSAGIPVRIRNAGVGGETSAGALRRLDWVLRQGADVLVIETGANDGLRGLPVEQLEANLDQMVQRVRESHPSVTVVIAQMEAPPNMGADYADAFRAVFPRVAERWDVPLIPFLLDGVAGNPELNQADGMHPTAEGARIMARNAWPVLEPILREREAG